MEKIKKLREKTGAGIMDVKNALDEAKGDEKKAEEILKAKGVARAGKKADRETRQGLIDCYIHLGKLGVMVEVNCETDFVSRNDEFKAFVHELAIHIASNDVSDVEELLKQEYFRDQSKTVEDLLHGIISKTGENVKIKRFVKYSLGE
jgi:elongation factor Ts